MPPYPIFFIDYKHAVRLYSHPHPITTHLTIYYPSLGLYRLRERQLICRMRLLTLVTTLHQQHKTHLMQTITLRDYSSVPLLIIQTKWTRLLLPMGKRQMMEQLEELRQGWPKRRGGRMRQLAQRQYQDNKDNFIIQLRQDFRYTNKYYFTYRTV